MRGQSASALAKALQRKELLRTTGGRCFYCGIPLHCDGEPLNRDWIMLRLNHMTIDHKTPAKREGTDMPDNYVPACRLCNHQKHSLTLDEYRLFVGLRKANFSDVFACEPIRIPKRDWLFVHSYKFEPALVIHNFPASAIRWPGKVSPSSI